MKIDITYSREEVLNLIRDDLCVRGLVAPDDPASFITVHDENGVDFGVQVLGVNVAPVPRAKNGAMRNRSVVPASSEPEEPEPVKPVPVKPEPEVTPADIERIHAASASLLAQGPQMRGAVPKNTPTRLAKSLEEMGKDPTDISDEI